MRSLHLPKQPAYAMAGWSCEKIPVIIRKASLGGEAGSPPALRQAPMIISKNAEIMSAMKRGERNDRRPPIAGKGRGLVSILRACCLATGAEEDTEADVWLLITHPHLAAVGGE